MTDRVVDCSSSAASLRLEKGLLVIEAAEGVRVGEFAITDLFAVILGHQGIRITGGLLGALAEANVAVICCDSRRRPSGMMLPLEAMHAQTSRFRAQTDLSLPAKKRIWQAIVRAKIRAQAQVLLECRGTDFGLREFAKRVQSGDTGNVEAQAARHYWPKLFPDERFVRRDEDDERNHLLNYGYAILRAAVARSLCASGLHPGFGVQHCSPYNTFPLADDLLEPFRPCVDRAVVKISEAEKDRSLNQTNKRKLLEIPGERYTDGRESRTVLDWILRSAQALAAVVVSGSGIPELPELKLELETSADKEKKHAGRAISNHVALRNVRSAG
jgi:CRISP-associated protein Cas1